MQLIDGDYVRDEILYGEAYVSDELAVYIKRVFDNAPTIDPESLRPQGEWVDVYGNKYANHRYVCSHCEVDALYKIEANALGHERYVQALSDSCPHCGANMKGAGR